MAVKERKENKTLNNHLADFIRSDSEFMDGIKRGVKACKEGRTRSWAEVKRELGL